MRSPARALLVLASLAPALAQNFGEITGTVSDSTGAVLPNATVSIVSAGTGASRRVQANQAGAYSAPFLVPGVYDVSAESAGFKTMTRRGVDLQVGQIARIDFSLAVGDVSQTVEVSGGAPLLATENAAIGTVVENRRIVELPLNGRNYLQLVMLSPNVSTEGGAGGGGGLQGGERAQNAISVAGMRLEFNRYTLDGVENTDVNFNSYIIRPSIEALQEFKVQSGIYSAEYGRAVSQINATTKQGGNNFHGSVFEFLRNSAMDAKEWRQDGRKNPFRRNQFGFTATGPVIRNRIFFLANYEGLRDRKTLQTVANVATARMRDGDFSGQTRRIFDHLTRQYTTDATGNQRAVSALPYPNQTIPRSRFNAIGQKLLEFYPNATVPGDATLRNFVRQASRPIDQDQFTGRLDWAQSQNSNWFGRYSQGDDFQGDVVAFPLSTGRVGTTVYQTMLSNTRTFGPSLVNEFRLGYNQFRNDRVGYYAFQRDVASELGIVGLVAANPASWGFPAIGLGTGVDGFSSSDPFISRNHTFQAMDNVSKISGRHTIRFGGEVRRDRYNQLGNQKATGEFLHDGRATFDPSNRTATGHSFADFLIGETYEAARALTVANAMLRANSYYFYFQDDWKLTPKLTLNLGIRYENSRPWKDKYRGIANIQIFDLGINDNGLLPASQTKVPILTRPGSGDFYEGLPFRFHDGIPVQAGDQFLGRSLVNPDNNDFAPRLGVAYSPTASWTVRTGVGLFYTRDTANPVYDMSRNLAGRGLFNSDVERPNSNISDPWRFQREQFRCTGFSGTCLGPPQVLGNIVNRRSPYILQWMFNVQRQLTQDTVVEFGYLGNGGRRLERMRTFNQPVLKSGFNDARTIAQRSPWPAYGRLQEVDGIVNSNYHSLAAKLQQRFARGLTYLMSFTWSKAIDTGSAIRTNSGDNLYPRDSYDLSFERGLSQFHVGRRLATSILYELPFGPGQRYGTGRALGAFVGGWQIGSIVTFADGAPLNVATIGDSNSVNQLGNYPDATGISPIPSDRGPGRFWDPLAFNAGNPELSFRSGNVGRNPLLKPGTRVWDFSAMKNFRIREGHTLQLRLESFNFSNHPNWNSPPNDARAPANFGRVTTARTMRENQVALKYLF